MNEFTNRFFKLWAYTVSHSFLILRSQLKFPDQEGYNESNNFNIDIEFSAVAYLDIPNTFQGIELSELTKDIPVKLAHYKILLGYKIFELKSENKMHYIVAGGYRIGKNKWVSDDRVQNMHLEYDEIIETS